MEGRALLDELLRFAGTVGLEVRVQPFARPGRSAGGLCLLRGRQTVLVDASAPLVDQTSALAEALAEALGDQAPTIAESPAVHRALEAAAARTRWRRGVEPPRRPPLERRVSVLRRPKPGLRSVRPKG